ncbi:hypothetical protein C8034_v001065 [Colletotrichum sidae]|uniref:Uncharacterized protein n=1 Tax=Colletotrichum sidae TaxID=1347389 RepID=A0A4R8TEV3_9PEZI|nr:hypothetical protein C8034_v001065 [Colletotrichum sidae]
MQLTTVTSGLLALAATVGASPIMGYVKMFYDPYSDCSGDVFQPQGQQMAISPSSVDKCTKVFPGLNNVTYKRFSASGITPIFSFELYNDVECTQLATNGTNVCVSNVKSYIPRRLDGN